MFKKFKDKLAEEMKQSPARLQASMQQLAQAVPSITNISTSELSTSNDNFSISEGDDDTLKNTPDKYKLQPVDLTSYSSNSMGLSRTSSVNSITSIDTSGLFPIYESPGSTYHLQSDMDQSASEADEHINPQFDQISKEQIYAAYRKIQTKYQRYRGRYADLVNYYREMERAKSKLESLLVETQDKALRRIADLKEQCQLEQQAKAHLEEALRNDIEEKGHIIDTLNTKVKLLQANGSSALIAFQNQENLIDITDNQDKIHNDYSVEQLGNISSEQPLIVDTVDSSVQLQLTEENQQLKNKLEKLETLLLKYKESLKRSKDKISETMQDKIILERDLEMVKNSNREQLQLVTDRLHEAKAEIIVLNEKINAMKQVEEESAISLAENKLLIHHELKIKEEQIKQLTLELKNSMQIRDITQVASNKNLEIADTPVNIPAVIVENEFAKINAVPTESNNIEYKNNSQQEEIIKSLNEMIDVYVADLDEAKKKIQAQNTEMIQLTKESKDNYEKLKVEFQNKCDDIAKLENDLINNRSIINHLNDKLKDNTNICDNLMKERNNLIQNIGNYTETIRSLKNNCDQLKSTFMDNKNHYNDEIFKISQLIQCTLYNYQSQLNTINSDEKIKSYESELQEKNLEIININSKLCDFEAKNGELIAELNIKNSEISNITNEQTKMENYIQEIVVEKDLLDEKLRKIEFKYADQLDIIHKLEKEIDVMRQKNREHEEKIIQYNDEKQDLIKNKEQIVILEKECEKLKKEMAEKIESFQMKISTIESENNAYKNNIEENSIELKNMMDKYNTISRQYENAKSEVERNATLLQEELNKSQNLIADYSKHSDEKSALNIQIQNLTDMVQAKNEFIEKLKHCKVKFTKIIQEKDCEIESLLVVKKTLENLENEKLHLNDNYSKHIAQLTDENTKLFNTNMELQTRDDKYKNLEERLINLLNKNKELESELDQQRIINNDLKCQIQESNNLQTTIEDLQNYKEKSEIEKKELKNVENELSKANQLLQDDKNLLEERVDELEKLSQVYLNQIAQLKKEIEIEESQQENHDTQAENHLRRVVEELQSQLQEKESMFIANQAAQTKIESVNEELKNTAEVLRTQLATFEAEQALRMQQLVKEFQARLHDKDTEIQAALDQKFDWQKNYESELVQQYREQLKDFQHELTAKSEEIENLKSRGKPDDGNREIEKLIETIASIKIEHANELKECDIKWREVVKQKCDQLETKHNAIINELTNEWKKNKFNDENIDQNPEELENVSAMAMAAVQSNTGSFHSLQQTLINQRRELVELRKLVKIRHETLDDSTEIEYLRNILYEYMMGKETLVLARVIAAVVKFDQDQTDKILKKEEYKLTLLGSLGLT